jgi:7-cyano-7-deazaguanine reductase
MANEGREAGGARREEEDADRKYGDRAVAAAADPAQWEIWEAPEGQREVLYQSFPEFTCLCPRSGYPDFATVHLVTIPDRKVLELKHLKLWLNSFRDRRISHEAAAAEIVDTLARTLDLFYAFILMAYTPRGNLLTVPMIEYRRPGLGELPETDRLVFAFANAARVRDRLIDLAIKTAQP